MGEKTESLSRVEPHYNEVSPRTKIALLYLMLVIKVAIEKKATMSVVEHANTMPCVVPANYRKLPNTWKAGCLTYLIFKSL